MQILCSILSIAYLVLIPFSWNHLIRLFSLNMVQYCTYKMDRILLGGKLWCLNRFVCGPQQHLYSETIGHVATVAVGPKIFILVLFVFNSSVQHSRDLHQIHSSSGLHFSNAPREQGSFGTCSTHHSLAGLPILTELLTTKPRSALYLSLYIRP